MNNNEGTENSLIPAAKDKSELKGKIKGELIGAGLGLAGSILSNIAKQSASFTESTKKDIIERGGDVKGALKDQLKEHGLKVIDGVENDFVREKQEFSDNVIGHLSEVFGPNMAKVINSAQFVWNDFAAMEAARNMRKTMGKSDAIRDEGLTVPDDIRAYYDIRYGDDPKWNLLDIYLPGNADVYNKSYPVIINVHGGAWVYGDKDAYKFYCMSLAQRGFAVVNFSYRLAPEYKLPDQMTDVNDVFRWMCAHCTEYSLDMNNMFLISDSAGANLAGLYICIISDPEYARYYTFTAPEGIHFNAAAFNCGAFDPLRYIGEKELMRGLVTGDTIYLKDGMINVSEHLNSSFPPSFMMSCPGDFCNKFLKPMARAFEANNVKYVIKIYGSEEEPLSHVFHLSVRNELGINCSDLECGFFREYIV